jgi:hypothetical protein
LSPALSFVAKAMVETIILFGWTRIGLIEEDDSLCISTIRLVDARMQDAAAEGPNGEAPRNKFDITYGRMHKYLIPHRAVSTFEQCSDRRRRSRGTCLRCS